MSDPRHELPAAALRETIEREIAERPGRPDLADVLARARAIDADAVPESLHAVDEGVDEPERPDAVLAMYAGALREEIDEDVRARSMRPAAAPNEATPPRARRWTVAVLALAAAAVGAVGLAQLREAPSALELDRGPLSQASKSVEQMVDDHQWSRGVPTPAPRVQPTKPVPEKPEPVAAPEEPEPEPELAKPRPSLEQLEREAAEAWRAGHLGLAETKLRSIVARAGRSPKAELAYGDLFAVTKQRGGAARQSRAWKQYLRRFPSGRHADDARAGLCMRASGDSASACWSDYLSKHPEGTHAARARGELARDETR